MRFEPFQVDQMVDRRRRYQLDLDPRFPLAVKLLSFPALMTSPLRFNWHERLELFICVAGRGRFRMGERETGFARGDVVVVDNLKLHGLVDAQGERRLGVVIYFMPELVCSPASCPCDSLYLMPFFSRRPGVEPVLRAGERHSAGVLAALGKVLECHFSTQSPEAARQAGVKAHLIEALYYLAMHFGVWQAAPEQYAGRRRESLQFGRLYEHLRENYAEPITVAEAASMAGMSEYRFMRFFKRATGMTFVTYLTHLRLSNAHRLLTETRLSIAEIAAAAGFADQSYFDRRFRQIYGQSPRDVRAPATAAAQASPGRIVQFRAGSF